MFGISKAILEWKIKRLIKEYRIPISDIKLEQYRVKKSLEYWKMPISDLDYEAQQDFFYTSIADRVKAERDSLKSKYSASERSESASAFVDDYYGNYLRAIRILTQDSSKKELESAGIYPHRVDEILERLQYERKLFAERRFSEAEGHVSPVDEIVTKIFRRPEHERPHNSAVVLLGAAYRGMRFAAAQMYQLKTEQIKEVMKNE